MIYWEYYAFGAAILILVLFNFRLYRRIRKLEKKSFSYHRILDQKTSILENTLCQLSTALPPALNPELREKKLLASIEHLVQEFSITLNKSTQQHLTLQNDLWNEKFSALLRVFGKNERDLALSQDPKIAKAWTSIVDLRRKSQLLFDDMREDGVFYRLQSLWLLGSLGSNQGRPAEAARHFSAAFRLYKDSLPKLPLSKHLMWQIAEDFVACSRQLDRITLSGIIEKFYLDPAEIARLFGELETTYPRPDVLQRLRNWASRAQR